MRTSRWCWTQYTQPRLIRTMISIPDKNALMSVLSGHLCILKMLLCSYYLVTAILVFSHKKIMTGMNMNISMKMSPVLVTTLVSVFIRLMEPWTKVVKRNNLLYYYNTSNVCLLVCRLDKHCENKNYNHAKYTCVNKTCVLPKDVGDYGHYCNFHLDCKSQFCNSDGTCSVKEIKCTEEKRCGVGGKCDRSSQCAFPLECENNKCERKSTPLWMLPYNTLGVECEELKDCQFPLYCDDSTTPGTCQKGFAFELFSSILSIATWNKPLRPIDRPTYGFEEHNPSYWR